MEPNKIYIIQGHTGEYPDKVSWFVRAYLNKESAIENLIVLKNTLFDITNKGKMHEKEVIKQMKYIDTNFQLNYTGTWYTVEEVEVCST